LALLCDGIKGSGGIAPCIYNLDIIWRWVFRFMLRSFYRMVKPLVPIKYEIEWTPEPSWTLYRKEKCVSAAGIEPCFSVVQSATWSLYGLNYLGSLYYISGNYKCNMQGEKAEHWTIFNTGGRLLSCRLYIKWETGFSTSAAKRMSSTTRHVLLPSS